VELSLAVEMTAKMKASECILEDAQHIAGYKKHLAESMSFIQVEYGHSELVACWEGFVDTSDSYGQNFTTKYKICMAFAEALAEYIEYLEPTLTS
jgi:hypothetical protein